MADILIRGMEMPKHTTKVEFGIDADGNPLCMVYHEDGTEPDIYDVVPLQEGHGDLIDAEDLDVDEVYTTEYGFQRVVWADLIDSAPIIIPASEGGGEE